MVQNVRNSTANLTDISQAMLDLLDVRSKDVITRRFGLKKGEVETLESIGQEYGITRERVRQIEAGAKKTLAGLSDLHKPAQELLAEVFQLHGGILAEGHAVSVIRDYTNSEIPANTVVFFLTILPAFTFASPSKAFAAHWSYDNARHPLADKIIFASVEALKAKLHPVSSAELFATVRTRLATSEDQLPDNVIVALLMASTMVDPTVFGQWGLVTWPETHPRGVGDKAYAVLRRHAKPSHFREITDLINQATFDHKRANPQTVHNELIKDGRFVLVGRGLYGLKEWGYMSGTVADVLEAILKDAQQPLTSDELIGRVLKQRIVKKNTILLSLQNAKRFNKTATGYTLRQKS